MGDGAGNGVRTRDPKLGKLVLYQLSYARFFHPHPGSLVSIRKPASTRRTFLAGHSLLEAAEAIPSIFSEVMIIRAMQAESSTFSSTKPVLEFLDKPQMAP